MISVQVGSMGPSARIVQQHLGALGIKVWVCMDMQGGDQYRDEIVSAVDQCNFFVIMCNQRWAESGECLDEFNLFMRNVRDGLGAEVEPGDVAALTVAMTHVQHVKYTAADIDGSSVAPSLFDRLNGMVVVLRK